MVKSMGAAYAVGFCFLLSGCGSEDEGTSSAGEEVTWHRDVAPLVAEKCTGCHEKDGIAPFSLESYTQAKGFAKQMAASVADGSMPPFLARTTGDCEPRYGFKDDLRLSEEQKALIAAWADQDAPEGDEADAADLPEPPSLDLDDADLEVKIPTPVTLESGADRFVCFSLAPDLTPLAPSGAGVPEALTQFALLDGMQVRAGNAKIVHHVLVFADPNGESAELAGEDGAYDCFGGPGLSQTALVMAWAPGSVPLRPPERVAVTVPVSARLVMQIHYHPTGSEETDSDTAVLFSRYDAGLPEYAGGLTLIGNESEAWENGAGLLPGPNDADGVEFRIPANASDHHERMAFPLGEDAPEMRLWAIGTHMHYVGTDMRIELDRADAGDEPESECLIETPDWDFNWQRGYVYDTPIESAPSVTAGDTIRLDCGYDNSMNNHHVAAALREQNLDAPRDVVLGESTLDEMCLGAFGLAQKLAP